MDQPQRDPPMTMLDKIWSRHSIVDRPDGETLLYIDRHLIFDAYAPAFEFLKARGLKVRSPHRTLATPDHYVPTDERQVERIGNAERRAMVTVQVEKLIDFVTRWDRSAPIVVHCFAGISRSTAGAFITACALNPARDETTIAKCIRDSSPTAIPNMRLVTLADKILGREGRMVKAVQAIGPGVSAYEGIPFRLDLE